MGTSSAQNEAEAAELREAADEAVDAREAAEAAAATREPSGVIAVGSTMSSVAPSSAGSSSHTNGNVAGLKMQLEDANRDAEDLRRYNASMRREHAATLADLEEELEGERSCPVGRGRGDEALARQGEGGGVREGDEPQDPAPREGRRARDNAAQVAAKLVEKRMKR